MLIDEITDSNEKQENLDMLEEELRKNHEDSLADEVVAFLQTYGVSEGKIIKC